ncbi:MAG: hypothetical protein WC655_07470 [Candidatus Hydrogenedentales bacterium]
MSTIASDTPARMRLYAAAAFLASSCAVVYCAFFAGYPIDHDGAVMLQVGEIMRNGGVPYRDIIEITPPMAPVVHIVPVLISELTPISLPVAFHLCVTLVLALSCWQVWSLLGLWKPPFSSMRRLYFLSGWLLATVSLQLTLDYGQREHLFALMLLPWLLCRIARYEDTRVPYSVAISLGIVASPCFLFKPFFLAVVIAIEFVLLMRSRNFRKLATLENALLLCWGAAYFIYLMTLPQDARQELFGLLIPLLAKHYNAYWGDFFHIQNILTYAWVVAVVAFAAAILRGRPAHVRFHALMLFLTVVFCAGAYWVQGKGWFYHQIPMRLAATAMLAFVLCSHQLPIGYGGSAQPKGLVVVLSGAILLCLPAAAFLISGIEYRIDRITYTNEMTAKIRQYAAPGEFVTFICTDVRRNYPAMIYAGVSLGSRYDVDFMIPMVYHGVESKPMQRISYRSASEQTDEERLYLKRKAEDIARFRPKLVAIDTEFGAQALPAAFRLDQYLEDIGWRKSALADYRYVENFCAFSLYVPK